MRRKLLMGVLALTLPLGTVAGLSSTAFATKAPPNPTSCNFSATVTITPQLSVAGTPSVKNATSDTVVQATYSSCTIGGPFTQTLNIEAKASKPGKDTAAIAAGDNKKDYYLGLCGAFTGSGTVKDLKKSVKNLAFAGGVLKGAKAAEGVIVGGSDLGFNITHGTVKGGTYPTASHAAVIAAGLTNDANNTNLLGGCNSGPVSTIDIDATQSHATL